MESDGDANLAFAIANAGGCWMDNTFAILHWDDEYTIVMRNDESSRKGIQLPGIDPDDKAEYISVHVVECIQCREHSFIGDEKNTYDWQSAHYNNTDHATYWHYTISRSRGRLIHPARGHF
jgi:hypothetical protein